jgi:hypothetical protein
LSHCFHNCSRSIRLFCLLRRNFPSRSQRRVELITDGRTRSPEIVNLYAFLSGGCCQTPRAR